MAAFQAKEQQVWGQRYVEEEVEDLEKRRLREEERARIQSQVVFDISKDRLAFADGGFAESRFGEVL